MVGLEDLVDQVELFLNWQEGEGDLVDVEFLGDPWVEVLLGQEHLILVVSLGLVQGLLVKPSQGVCLV